MANLVRYRPYHVIMLLCHPCPRELENIPPMGHIMPPTGEIIRPQATLCCPRFALCRPRASGPRKASPPVYNVKIPSLPSGSRKKYTPLGPACCPRASGPAASRPLGGRQGPQVGYFFQDPSGKNGILSRNSLISMKIWNARS